MPFSYRNGVTTVLMKGVWEITLYFMTIKAIDSLYRVAYLPQCDISSQLEIYKFHEYNI